MNISKKEDRNLIFYANNSLWGKHGGQLELVSITFKVKGSETYAILKFTDHDVAFCKDAPVDDYFYLIEVPVSDFFFEETINE